MKNIVITGASRGIGFEIAKLALQKGHRVLAIARNEKSMQKLSSFEKKNNGELHILSLDLIVPESMGSIKDKLSQWDKIDGLINNAGVLINKPFDEIELADIEKSIYLNYIAPLRLCQIALPKMNKESHIVNISTMGAVQGSAKFPGLSVYSSSKAALTGLTELLAEEFKENGPRVNALALGAVQTEMLEEAFPGYVANVQPVEMAQYIFNFLLTGHQLYNGKILTVSNSTP